MAGQGRNPAEQGDSSQKLNVVRFPGSWFGPVEELAPIPSLRADHGAGGVGPAAAVDPGAVGQRSHASDSSVAMDQGTTVDGGIAVDQGVAAGQAVAIDRGPAVHLDAMDAGLFWGGEAVLSAQASVADVQSGGASQPGAGGQSSRTWPDPDLEQVRCGSRERPLAPLRRPWWSLQSRSWRGLPLLASSVLLLTLGSAAVWMGVLAAGGGQRRGLLEPGLRRATLLAARRAPAGTAPGVRTHTAGERIVSDRLRVVGRGRPTASPGGQPVGRAKRVGGGLGHAGSRARQLPPLGRRSGSARDPIHPAAGHGTTAKRTSGAPASDTSKSATVSTTSAAETSTAVHANPATGAGRSSTTAADISGGSTGSTAPLVSPAGDVAPPPNAPQQAP